MVNLIILAGAVGFVYLMANFMEGHKEMSERSNFNGETIYRTALLEWVQADSTRWDAKHPEYHDEGSACKYSIELIDGKYWLMFEGDIVMDHCEPFDSFFDAVFWAEARALRDCVQLHEEMLNDGSCKKIDQPGYASKYFNGCRAVAIFSPFRNQGMTTHAEQTAEKRDYFSEMARPEREKKAIEA